MANSNQGYPVAPDEGSAVDTAIPPVEIWLLDHNGKRMGARPEAEHPVHQTKGAYYRITFESGEVRLGHADEEGLLVEYGVQSPGSKAKLEWGEEEDARASARAPDDDELSDLFLYEEEISLVTGDDLEASQMLANLGYQGEGDEARSRFTADYGSADDETIAGAHDTGRERGATA